MTHLSSIHQRATKFGSQASGRCGSTLALSTNSDLTEQLMSSRGWNDHQVAAWEPRSVRPEPLSRSPVPWGLEVSMQRTRRALMGRKILVIYTGYHIYSLLLIMITIRQHHMSLIIIHHLNNNKNHNNNHHNLAVVTGLHPSYLVGCC